MARILATGRKKADGYAFITGLVKEV